MCINPIVEIYRTLFESELSAYAKVDRLFYVLSRRYRSRGLRVSMREQQEENDVFWTPHQQYIVLKKPMTRRIDYILFVFSMGRYHAGPYYLIKRWNPPA